MSGNKDVLIIQSPIYFILNFKPDQWPIFHEFQVSQFKQIRMYTI